jgi:hypothetical protein
MSGWRAPAGQDINKKYWQGGKNWVEKQLCDYSSRQKVCPQIADDWYRHEATRSI